MAVLLYKRRFDIRSGAGQLIRTQARGLEAAGENVALACQRGATRFFLRTGLPARRVPARAADALCGGASLVVDHECALRRADIVFVHNCPSEAARYLEDSALADAVAREAAYFAELDAGALIVANSGGVSAALARNHAVDPARIVVHYPGIDARRFDSTRTAGLRRRARATLGIANDAPLIGFVTSGALHKRGLDIFLDAAERISASMPKARFLVVGARQIPQWARSHPIVAAGRVSWRPKNRFPERWIASLDLFLYAARYEEFGMVVTEAQALGIPVITSRRVGAVECMPEEYGPWLVDRPDRESLADRALTLLADEDARRMLVAAGLARAAGLDREGYARGTVATILGFAGATSRLSGHS